MVRYRSARARLHSPALVTVAALPLVLSTSSTVMLPTAAPEDPPPSTSMMAEMAEAEAALAPVTTADPTVTAPTARRASVVDVRAGDIPWAALQGYKRAADILAEVEGSCGISWTLLAAVGQVSSRHGQVADSELGPDAVARPDIVGAAATAASARVADTDAGQIDGDADEDRAVGPMQLQPAVWSVAGVDGDGDGRRSPHDVDDAALAAAVFLCATGERLGDEDGAAAALRGLNHSPVYVEQVLAVEAEYAAGDFAVADPPALQTIGKLLDTGSSAPARTETARAVKRITDEGRPVERRKPAKSVATRTPDAAAPAKPAAPVPSEGKPVPSETDEPAKVPATEEPTAPAPAEQPTAEEPTAPAPAEEPTAPAPAQKPVVEDPQAEEPRVEEPPAEDPVEDPPVEEEPPAEEPPAEEPPAEEPPAEEPPAEEPPGEEPPVEDPPAEEPETVEVEIEGTWTTCDEGYCLEVVSEETGEAVLLVLDVDPELLGKTDEDLVAMVGQVFSLLVVEGTEPLVVTEILPPETE